MAIIKYEVLENTVDFKKIKWSGVTENDVCEPFEFKGASDKAVHISGTFGTGVAGVYGSLIKEDMGKLTTDGSAGWTLLTNVDGLGDITISEKKMATILEPTPYIRPAPVSGAGMSVDIYIVAIGGK